MSELPKVGRLNGGNTRRLLGGGIVDLIPCRVCRVRPGTVCGPLADEDLPGLASIRSIVRYPAGAILFNEGARARHVFSVSEGTIQVFRLLPDGRRQITGFFFAGDFLGLSNSGRYGYGAVTVVETAVCRFPRTALEEMIERSPKAASHLLALARDEIAAAQDHIVLLGRKTARERLASLLLLLAERIAQRDGGIDHVIVPMSRSDIGDYLGLTSETVSRVMSQLKQDGVIAPLPGGRIEFRDLEKLRAMAAGYHRGAKRTHRR